MQNLSIEDQFGVGAALELGLKILQHWSKFPWIDEQKTKITIAARVVLSVLATLGIGWHYQAQNGTLVITGLTLTAVLSAVWAISRQYLIQHGFGKLLQNGNLDAFRAVVQAVVRAELAAMNAPPAPGAAPAPKP